jgi:hypothetical protein
MEIATTGAALMADLTSTTAWFMRDNTQWILFLLFLMLFVGAILFFFGARRFFFPR